MDKYFPDILPDMLYNVIANQHQANTQEKS